MKEKINFKRLAEISLEEIQVLSEEIGESKKGVQPVQGGHTLEFELGFRVKTHQNLNIDLELRYIRVSSSNF